MKKIWSVPEAIAEQFAANEYVAACHDINKVYKFTCDAPAGTICVDWDNDGDVDRFSGYHPCEKKHESPVSDTYYLGYVDRNGNRQQDEGEAAYIWLEFSRNWWTGDLEVSNGHATANLDMNSWETAKS
jgi:hypothetical protein